MGLIKDSLASHRWFKYSIASTNRTFVFVFLKPRASSHCKRDWSTLGRAVSVKIRLSLSRNCWEAGRVLTLGKSVQNFPPSFRYRSHSFCLHQSYLSDKIFTVGEDHPLAHGKKVWMGTVIIKTFFRREFWYSKSDVFLDMELDHFWRKCMLTASWSSALVNKVKVSVEKMAAFIRFRLLALHVSVDEVASVMKVWTFRVGGKSNALQKYISL